MNKKREKVNTKKEKIIKENEQIENSIFNKLKTTYIGYTGRVIIFLLLFFAALSISLFLVGKSLTVSNEKIINYRENGSLDYKVNLKPNDFYEEPFLGRDMLYVASLIKNIDLDFNYQFMISENKNLDFSYSVVADLKITDQTESNVYYEKQFVLLDNKKAKVNNSMQYMLNEKVTIDYDYYNSIANDFKTSYGIDGVSNLTVYLKINKNVLEGNENSILNNGSSMSVKIPLSQKSISIKIDDNGINATNNIVTEKSVALTNILSIIVAAILFIGSVAALLKTLELLALLFPKKSNYDKQVEKILKEYDRLIVETPTVPDLTDKNIIKIKRFEELLDARDNLKLPIMYHNLTSHQKCYFYIRQEETIYLMVLKATDVDVDDKKEKAKK